MARASELLTPPSADAGRLQALDIIRGAAVLGILLVNMQLFAMPNAATANPYALGQPSFSDLAVWSAIEVLAESKFITIFSMLFGAGVVLMTSRVEQRGLRPARLHYRRMFWLLVFGLVHAYLLWHGDILVAYAICGMLVYPARRLSARTLAVVGVLLMSVAMASALTAGFSWPYFPDELKAEWQSYWQPSPGDVADETAAFKGGWLAQQSWRASYSAEFHLQDFIVWDLWRLSGLMLLGMALLKWAVLTGGKTRRQYAVLTAMGLATGLPLAALGLSRLHAAGWRLPEAVFFAPQWNYWGSLLAALGYIGLLMTIWQAGVARGLTSRLAAVGRTAFSCYILETLIGTAIFYGHGLGLFGSVDRLQQLILTVAVWFVLLLLAPLWLRRFNYGPLEWLWRTLTYGRVASIRRDDRREATT
ncbi:MAG TPA: DUF418 domain-containing protein [Vicinamibacterales bacterium]|nr:DUF418 domain-containing protein [Vicinamibacterales bacterium]